MVREEGQRKMVKILKGILGILFLPFVFIFGFIGALLYLLINAGNDIYNFVIYFLKNRDFPSDDFY